MKIAVLAQFVTSKNAGPFSPSDIPVSEVYEFNVYHLCEVDNPCELFPIETFEV